MALALVLTIRKAAYGCHPIKILSYEAVPNAP